MERNGGNDGNTRKPTVYRRQKVRKAPIAISFTFRSGTHAGTGVKGTVI